MKSLTLEPLTREAFAPFGDVIALEGARHFPINAGTTERFHDLANVDIGFESGGRPLINVFRGQPRAQPVVITMMERHPLGSQAFVPLGDVRYLVVVAPAGEFDAANMRAFYVRGWQGVNYARGVWHHPLIVLDTPGDFIVVDRGGEQPNCDEIALPDAFQLVASASLAVELPA
ncbi:ureidoglycolate lyase [Caballeronia sp. ATUFL_M2_KS44]|uniref:ureidoglycolate lyase n=1 Tax=Caballeronia sp. ATUFL_M2_KS44 TaxID=2921767 RepID=UPI00202799F2|nr:ureidoglycolate lyase [Caballeronia sp. ATUFL_M2_KS44]